MALVRRASGCRDGHDFAQHEVNLAVTIARQVGFSLERAQAEAARRTAEDEMRESEERFRLMSEHAPVHPGRFFRPDGLRGRRRQEVRQRPPQL